MPEHPAEPQDQPLTVSQAPQPNTDDYHSAGSTTDGPTVAPAEPATGTKSHRRFTVLRPHAQGGLGRVSLARDEKLHRQVALKEIRADRQGDGALAQRFVAEAEITGQLEHPGIVPVYDIERDDAGRPYYAMRFIQGETLGAAIRALHAQRVDYRALAFRELLQRFVSVCQTIAYAHSKGVVHRDLKPANIMLGPYGETLVVDWGLAKRLGESDRPEAVALSPDAGASPASAGLTRAGQILGTPAYMAPEQAAGAETLGPAADIYALGTVLFQLLSGRPPYHGKGGAEVLALARAGKLPSLAAARLPHPLRAICARAMAWRPADRYATALELARDVESWLGDQPVLAYREPWSARLRRWARRHKPLVAGAATAVFFLLAGLITWMLSSYHQLELTRQQITDRMRVALEESHNGHLDQAISTLGEAERLGATEPPLAALVEQAAGQREHLEQHREFWKRAQAAQTPGIDVRRGDTLKDELDRLHNALSVYDPIGNPGWVDTLTEAPLQESQTAAVKDTTARILIRAAVNTLLLAQQEGSQDRLPRGLTMLARAEALQGPSESSCLLRVMLCTRLGNTAGAKAAGMQRKTVKAGTAFDFNMLAQFAMGGAKPNHPQAIAYFQQALSLEPDLFDAHYGMFKCHERQGKWAPAAEALTVCMALRPGEARLPHLRGVLYFHLGQYERASSDFTASIQRDKNFADPHYFRGRVSFIDGKYAEADKDLSRSLELDPKYASPYSWRGIARAKLKRFREAVQDAEAAVSVAKHSPDTDWHAARACSLAAAAVLADSAEPDRLQLGEQYGARAVELLRAAFDRGFRNLEGLRRSTDLDPLRSRSDFKKLLASVQSM